MEDLDRIQEGFAHRAEIVFITGYSSYMQDAFEVHAFHYLVKPRSKEKLQSVCRQIIKERQFREGQKNNICLLKQKVYRKKILQRYLLYRLL